MKRCENIALPDGTLEERPKGLAKLLNLNYLDVTNKAQAVGAFDLPAMTCNTRVLPDYIALYNHPGDYEHTAYTAVGFFLYDKVFDGKDGLFNSIYYHDEDRLAFFKRRFENVRMFIMPDFSQCGDVQVVENVYRQFKMRVVSLWLTLELDAVVIPLVTFPTLEFLPYILEGYENCSVVCFSTMGSQSDFHEKRVLRQAIELTVDTLELTDIVVFDVCRSDRKAFDLFSYAIDREVSVHVPNNLLKDRNASKGLKKHAQ